MPKSISGQGSALYPAGRSHNTPPDPLVGWGGGTPPHTSPHSAPTHLQRLPCVPQNSSQIYAYDHVIMLHSTDSDSCGIWSHLMAVLRFSHVYRCH